MSKHKKGNKQPGHPDTLEWYMEHFSEECEVCKSKMVVHAFRRKMQGKRRLVYAHCENGNGGKPCRNKMMVVCYIGA